MASRFLQKACLVFSFAIGIHSAPCVATALAQDMETGRTNVVLINATYDANFDAPQDEPLLHDDRDAVENDARTAISISRASNLVGTPATVVREQFGEDVVTSSFSDQPIVIIGAAPVLANAPLTNLRLTSSFGARRHPVDGVRRHHAGVDYGAAHGTPIMATGDATVTHAGDAGSYGLMVELDHGSGLETRYAHMSGVAVSVGERVTSGQVIGYVGSTGRSSGSHLHYETRVDGTAVDPLDR